ncbi:MAG: hypothetical protein WDM88_09155 [Galbitalea sp.]
MYSLGSFNGLANSSWNRFPDELEYHSGVGQTGQYLDVSAGYEISALSSVAFPGGGSWNNKISSWDII